MATETHLSIELDGGGVEPTNVESSVLLGVASRYLEAMEALIPPGHPLTFRGMVVKNKCVALQVQTSDDVLAKELAAMVDMFVGDVDEAPHGVEGKINELRAALRRVPADQTASIRVGDWVRPLRLPVEDQHALLRSRTSLRAQPRRVGGAEPRIQFVSPSEPYLFSARVDAGTARDIGSHLYKWLQVEISMVRDSEGRIRNCHLLSYEVVPQRDDRAVATLRDWFANNGRPWNEVKDAGSDSDDPS